MTEAQLRRIHVVTRHYRTLRGGVARALWLPAIAGGGFLALMNPFRGFVGLALGLLSIFGPSALAILAWIHMRRWMDLRFGRVHSRREVFTMVALMVAVYGHMASNDVDKRYATTADLPSFTFLGSAAFGAWLVLSVGRYGIHNLIPTVVSLVAAFGLIEVQDQAGFESWQTRAFFMTAGAWILSGLLDFTLLWKTLGRTVTERGVADVG